VGLSASKTRLWSRGVMAVVNCQRSMFEEMSLGKMCGLFWEFGNNRTADLSALAFLNRFWVDTYRVFQGWRGYITSEQQIMFIDGDVKVSHRIAIVSGLTYPLVLRYTSNAEWKLIRGG